MATHSSILAWRVPWLEDPGWLQSMGLQRIRQDRATNPQTHTLLMNTAVWQVLFFFSVRVV